MRRFADFHADIRQLLVRNFANSPADMRQLLVRRVADFHADMRQLIVLRLTIRLRRGFRLRSASYAGQVAVTSWRMTIVDCPRRD